MFKRVDKRRRKQQEEEALGLDGDMKDALGIPETDSDESDSSEADDEPIARKTHDHTQSGYETEDESESGDNGERPPISVRDALRDPFYFVTGESAAKLCIICPGKFLKTPQMIEVHKASSAHTRRFKRFTNASRDDIDGSAWDYQPQLNSMQSTGPLVSTGELSKRAAKRKARQEFVKAKRDQRKRMLAKVKAKKGKEAVGTSREEPESEIPIPTKRRKVENRRKERSSESSPDERSPKDSLPSLLSDQRRKIKPLLRKGHGSAAKRSRLNGTRIRNIDSQKGAREEA